MNLGSSLDNGTKTSRQPSSYPYTFRFTGRDANDARFRVQQSTIVSAPRPVGRSNGLGALGIPRAGGGSGERSDLSAASDGRSSRFPHRTQEGCARPERRFGAERAAGAGFSGGSQRR